MPSISYQPMLDAALPTTANSKHVGVGLAPHLLADGDSAIPPLSSVSYSKKRANEFKFSRDGNQKLIV